MPFIGFLGPTWEVIVLTRILHRQSVYYHSIYEYSSIFCIFSAIALYLDINIDIPMYECYDIKKIFYAHPASYLLCFYK